MHVKKYIKKIPYTSQIYHALKVLLACIKLNYRIFNNFVVIPIDGGTGSQIGQYLLGCAVEHSSGLQVKYDLSWYEHGGMDLLGENKREFSLLKLFPSLSHKMKIASKDESLIYRTFFNFSLKDIFEYDKNVLFSKQKRYLDGYYINRLYIEAVKNDIQNILVFDVEINGKNARYLKQICQSKNSVAIHVRRGDFINSINDVANQDYFLRAIELMRQSITNPTFFVFSNDIAWAKDAFAAFIDFVYLDANDNDAGHIDLYLMSQCKNFIISNSSFSGCAATLSPHAEKIIMCPYTFFKHQKTEDLGEIQKAMAPRLDPSWIPVEFTI